MRTKYVHVHKMHNTYDCYLYGYMYIHVHVCCYMYMYMNPNPNPNPNLNPHWVTHPWSYVAVDLLALPVVSEQLCLVPGVQTLLPHVLLHHLHVLVCWGKTGYPHIKWMALIHVGVHVHCTYMYTYMNHECKGYAVEYHDCCNNSICTGQAITCTCTYWNTFKTRTL